MGDLMSERKINHDCSTKFIGQPQPKKLSDEAKLAYLKHPNHCPYCGSTEIESDSVNYGDMMTGNVLCLKCNKNWIDVYSVTDIEEVP
jgi:hypothetical protein